MTADHRQTHISLQSPHQSQLGPRLRHSLNRSPSRSPTSPAAMTGDYKMVELTDYLVQIDKRRISNHFLRPIKTDRRSGSKIQSLRILAFFYAFHRPLIAIEVEWHSRPRINKIAALGVDFASLTRHNDRLRASRNP